MENVASNKVIEIEEECGLLGEPRRIFDAVVIRRNSPDRDNFLCGNGENRISTSVFYRLETERRHQLANREEHRSLLIQFAR